MTNDMLTDEDEAVIRGILEAQRQEGATRPLLPLDVDLDGDGITDAWGLGDDGQVVLVSGVSLTDTCYVSDGDDIREGMA
ncbi:hypothetical protein SEA_GINGERBUG_25 [Microbacterium phage Gingerbug]|nr:hypothetical protein SEA_GINGERBUG_25 [Microbacterium phage Gingerbug]